MRRSCALLVTLCVFLAGCGGQSIPPDPHPAGTVRLLFAGDVMVGRGVAPVLADAGPSLFEGTRFVVTEADLALANLESALSSESPATEDPSAPLLIGSSQAATVLAAAGFDVLSLANNHADDAGPGSVASTAAYLNTNGIDVVGLVETQVVKEVDGVRTAFLAFDLTGGSPETRAWDPDEATNAVATARRNSDIVAVSLHGGVEYLPGPDPALRRAVSVVAEAGADVVWAHGAHVTYPVEVIGDGARPAVVAYGLGNFLFDQQRRGTQEGLVLEVLVDQSGVIAHRVGTVEVADLRVRFAGWQLPIGDAVLLGGEWWQLSRSVDASPAQAVSGVAERHGEAIGAAGIGDATGDGRLEIVVAFRREYQERPVNVRFPDVEWTDADGMTAHLGIYRPEDLGPIWVASGIARPIADLAVCDGTLAVVNDSLSGDGAESSGAWTWTEFGFTVAPPLPGPGTPACVDVDLDGALDPVLLGRS
jgi:poly-gamma-glutamate synthesis protein (capsule biosynthesis protein)